MEYNIARWATSHTGESPSGGLGGLQGDSYDNAMAEAFNSLYKAELSFLEGLWRDRAQLEAATADWVHWFNIERLHSLLV
ncbi:integrase core domain-containing protein, partial [Yaniella sp.]|uniref:integrase core domain-containing protein n=1 Tax=Yaniella sp. TaxID=2773929 RepID=UPI0034630C36